MSESVDYRDVAKVFRNGRSQAVRLPEPCRFEGTEIEVVKRGSEVILRPRTKDWDAFFDAPVRGSLPPREQPPLQERAPKGANTRLTGQRERP